MRERGGEASKQEVDNERRRFAPKDAFHAGPWGGTRPHVIGNAGAVRGRSTGGCTRRTRCHRDSRDATTVSAAYYSPSAPAHTPHRSTCAHRGAPTAVAGPSALKRLIARFDGLGSAYALSGLRDERGCRQEENEEAKVSRSRRIHGKRSCDGGTAATRIRCGARRRQLRET
jgi:hypothetical protein